MKHTLNSRRATLGSLAALLLGGCGVGRWFGGKVPEGTVAGTLTWSEPTALPPGATLVVRLEEVAQPGASPALVAEQTMDGRERSPPVAFELRYRGDAISPDREYFVSAEVLLLERPMLASARPHAVLTRGRASQGLGIVLKRAGRSAED